MFGDGLEIAENRTTETFLRQGSLELGCIERRRCGDRLAVVEVSHEYACERGDPFRERTELSG